MLIRNVVCLSWFVLVQGNLMPSTYLGDTPYQYKPVHNLTTALRIQRDIAMNITIDQLLWPALDMSTAFFGNNTTFQKLAILHQPLLMGYQRLIFDLYYHPSDSNWQLCPVNASCNYSLQNLYDTVNDYLLSTEINGASPSTNLITLVLNLHHDENITTDLAPSILSVYKSRVYTPLNLTMYTHGQTEPYLWPQWLHLIQNKVQLLVAFGSMSSVVTVSNADKQVLFDQLGSAVTSTKDVNCSVPVSWSFVSDAETMFSYGAAYNMTQCGYSSLFTHNNYSGVTSIIDPGHLADNIVSTLWSWDVNQPDTMNGLYRCAAMVADNGGRWRANDCAEALHVACRTEEDTWIVTNETYNYDRSLSACPSNTVFEVPRIPRQNLQLREAMRQANKTTGVWLNLNLAYNQDGCWAVGYGTCWWTDEADMEYLGLIQTSIVSGVIVLLLVGIFTWVKCARLWRNRNSRSRKAMVKTMLSRREYVTVPA